MAADAELFEAWCRGDTRAGGELFDRHYPSIYRFFSAKLSGLDEVEDLVQQSFMASVEARARFRKDASFRSFLFGIARNLLLAHLRERHKRALDPLTNSLADFGRGPSTIAAQRREHQLLLTALRRIPIDSQVLLEMKYWEQMTVGEIADVLGEREGAIRGRLRTAKDQLRGTLEGLARSPAELDATIEGLELWAENLRGYWTV